MENMKKYGFTLAEVLITLGIVGVVATMTIPTLLANMNSAIFRNQYKKTLSVLSQAGKIAQERYDFTYGDSQACNTPTDSPFGEFTICGIFNGTLSAHKLSFGLPANYSPEGAVTSSAYPGTTVPNGMPLTAANAAYVIFGDGSMLVFNKDIHDCSLPTGQGITYYEGETKKKSLPHQCYAFIDVNGPKLPNKEVICSTGYTDPLDVNADCEVVSDFERSADIYPIVFHDSIAEPATNASRSILQKAKKSQ